MIITGLKERKKNWSFHHPILNIWTRYRFSIWPWFYFLKVLDRYHPIKTLGQYHFVVWNVKLHSFCSHQENKGRQLMNRSLARRDWYMFGHDSKEKWERHDLQLLLRIIESSPDWNLKEASMLTFQSFSNIKIDQYVNISSHTWRG